MKKVYYAKVECSNGYPKCHTTEYCAIETNSKRDAERRIIDFAKEVLYDLAHECIVVADGYDEDIGWLLEDYEDKYYRGCSYEYTFITEEEYNENVSEEDRFIFSVNNI